MEYGKRYRLKNGTRYDDSYGIGYNYVEPVEGVLPSMYMADCWIVNQNGDRHPGYCESPVPVRSEDVWDIDTKPEQYKAAHWDIPGNLWSANAAARDVLKLFDPTGKTHAEVTAWFAQAFQGAYDRGYKEGEYDITLSQETPEEPE